MDILSEFDDQAEYIEDENKDDDDFAEAKSLGSVKEQDHLNIEEVTSMQIKEIEILDSQSNYSEGAQSDRFGGENDDGEGVLELQADDKSLGGKSIDVKELKEEP